MASLLRLLRSLCCSNSSDLDTSLPPPTVLRPSRRQPLTSPRPEEEQTSQLRYKVTNAPLDIRLLNSFQPITLPPPSSSQPSSRHFGHRESASPSSPLSPNSGHGDLSTATSPLFSGPPPPPAPPLPPKTQGKYRQPPPYIFSKEYPSYKETKMQREFRLRQEAEKRPQVRPSGRKWELPRDGPPGGPTTMKRQKIKSQICNYPGEIYYHDLSDPFLKKKEREAAEEEWTSPRANWAGILAEKSA